MRFQQYLIEQQILELNRMREDTFMEMVKSQFKAFYEDIIRLSKFMVEPWSKRIDVMKMKHDGWKVVKHTSNGDHELWLLKKGNEEKLMGY